MAVLAFDLGTFSADGTGSAVDTSTAGRIKTINVQGSFVASVHVEISCGGLMFFPLKSFNNPECVLRPFAASSMRVRIEDYVSGTISVTVSSDDAGGLFTALPTPSSDGVGAAVDISTYGNLKTAIFGVTSGDGQLAGSHVVEFYPDNVHWGQVFRTFSGAGDLQTLEAPSFYARVRREGTSLLFSGTTAVYLGAVDDASGSGGNTGNIQAFQYTHAGADSSDFMVTLPAARASGTYIVVATLAGVTSIVGIDAPEVLAGDRTTTQFRVVTTGNITAGDQIDFVVVDVLP